MQPKLPKLSYAEAALMMQTRLGKMDSNHVFVFHNYIIYCYRIKIKPLIIPKIDRS